MSPRRVFTVAGRFPLLATTRQGLSTHSCTVLGSGTFHGVVQIGLARSELCVMVKGADSVFTLGCEIDVSLFALSCPLTRTVWGPTLRGCSILQELDGMGGQAALAVVEGLCHRYGAATCDTFEDGMCFTKTPHHATFHGNSCVVWGFAQFSVVLVVSTGSQANWGLLPQAQRCCWPCKVGH
eukprot:1813861-Amphidinium_carterae.1